jgi:hypothetical protein
MKKKPITPKSEAFKVREQALQKLMGAEQEIRAMYVRLAQIASEVPSPMAQLNCACVCFVLGEIISRQADNELERN